MRIKKPQNYPNYLQIGIWINFNASHTLIGVILMIDCKTSHAVLTLTKIIQFNADAIRLFLFGLSVTSTKQQSRTFAYSLVTAEELEMFSPFIRRERRNPRKNNRTKECSGVQSIIPTSTYITIVWIKIFNIVKLIKHALWGSCSNAFSLKQ